MINPEGRWTAFGSSGCGPKTVTFRPDGEAWRVTLLENEGSTELLGGGFFSQRVSLCCQGFGSAGC